jgi:hypothetical protein
MQTPEQTLLDLKYLLMESKQKCVSLLVPHPFGLLVFWLRTGAARAWSGLLKESRVTDRSLNVVCRVPPFLTSIEDPNLGADGKPVGCTNCGGTLRGLFPFSLSPLLHFSLFRQGVREADPLLMVHLQVSVTRSGTARSSKRTSGGRWPVLVAVATAVVAVTERVRTCVLACVPQLYSSYKSGCVLCMRFGGPRGGERARGPTTVAERTCACARSLAADCWVGMRASLISARTCNPSPKWVLLKIAVGSGSRVVCAQKQSREAAAVRCGSKYTLSFQGAGRKL